MARERRDSKNRILERGEYQKADGRYMYRYTDINGKARFVYSWTLTRSDRTPKGKTPGTCLRELEKQIAKDKINGIDTYAAEHLTLNDAWDKYIAGRTELKSSTRVLYKNTYNRYAREDIGGRCICTIRYSDIKELYRKLLDERHISIGTLTTLHNIIHPVFEIAVRDGIINRNPTTGLLGEIKKKYNYQATKRHALTVQQQHVFMEFLRTDKIYKKWYPFITVMLGTGCRAGEITGLCWCDCDFENGIISINHTMRYQEDEQSGKYARHITSPKTSAGTRQIPMIPEVKAILQNEFLRQKQDGFCKTVVDGYDGFVFAKKTGTPYSCNDIDAMLTEAVKRYNKLEDKQASLEKREPVHLPNFSSHILRHTFCTRFCENETNLKVIQEIMGHADIKTTMNVYNEASLDLKKQSLQSIAGKILV